ncbi:MAG: HAMP domain-containing histidine kinase [Actinobacteria bacterium]|nr:MAG: HAMP domain-containing histidine kinase [Actinomycetota bacterium]
MPAPLPFGGASGYFQFVHSDGTVSAPGGTPQLPVDARTRRAAQSGHGRYLTDETVRGTHLRVLTVADPYDRTAVQVARPLSEVDHVLHGLLLTFGLLVGGGILLAAALGGLVGRGALAPIRRFVGRTEKVSGALDRSERLEETGPAELVRLAASFNRTLDALEQSVAAQRHLVADASHELRTPIAALRSNIQIFLDSHRLPPAERQPLQEGIIAELDEITRLVSDVVELARSAEPSAELETFALDEVVAHAVERTRRRAPELGFDVALEPALLRADPERIARAVTNVLDNARKWSPPGGAIEVRLADGVLSVRDHGPGFDEQDLPHVFDRFYRAPAARRLPGSGLGLAIVRQAAEAAGGSADAENAPGGGARVRVSFGPTTRPAGQAPGAGRPAPAPPAAGRPRAAPQ